MPATGGGLGGLGGKGGVTGVWRSERNGKWDSVSNVLHSQGPGKRGGGCSAWVCANIVTVPKRWVLGTTPLTGRSVGKPKPGCSSLLRRQRQGGGVSAEASANLHKWNVLWVNKNQDNYKEFLYYNCIMVWARLMRHSRSPRQRAKFVFFLHI